ncbi:MAG: hypothetical protein IK071_07800 [Lachnospiraceae bacterium]|nr:hypothetical protein [Lachnospiraceae bacterium]
MTEELYKAGDESARDADSASKDTPHHTLFDDVFKTICVYMQPLLVPLVNEMFGTNYKMYSAEEMERYANEHMKLVFSEDDKPKVSKVISDFYMKLDGTLYHIECQSTEDGDILIRILDYNMRIAFENVEKDGQSGNLRVQLPHSALLMLRKSSEDEPKISYNTITYVYQDREFVIFVPVLHVQAYSMEEVFDKELYSLIPFFSIRYEQEIARISKNPLENREDYDKIYSELMRFTDLVYRACASGKLSEHFSRELAVLYRKIVNTISNRLDDQMKERLVNTMDGQVLELQCQKWYREARQAEKVNTEREKKRADEAEAKLREATAYIKELEAKLSQKS